MLRSIVCPALLASLIACSEGPAPPDAEGYQESLRAWQSDYLQSLVQPEGWLTLVGLLWLDEGENRFGSGDDVDLRLINANLPALAGVFTLRDGEVSFRAAAGAAFTADGMPVDEMAMDVDFEGDPATVLRIGSLHLIVIQRGGRYGLRIRDLENPMVLEFPGLDFYPAEPEWIIRAHFVPFDQPHTITVPDVTGAVRELPSPGRAVFELRGHEHSLIAVDQSSTNELFFMFADRTSGNATYGAGRYLFSDYPDSRGNLILDFNHAHNPPCAYTRHAVCPLPPSENRLPFRITAGERDFLNSGEH